MVSPKKIIKMARKWRMLTAIGRKRISLPRTTGGVDADTCNTAPLADKGHFVVYSADQKRFMIPLVYLNNDIFRELFQMAEEEFGLPRDGPITLPCDAAFMEYAVALIQGQVAKDLEALLMSITTGRCLSSLYLHQEQRDQQLLLCGF